MTVCKIMVCKMIVYKKIDDSCKLIVCKIKT